MGLNITAYEKVTYAGPTDFDIEGDGQANLFYNYPDLAERADGIVEGLYDVSGKKLDFRAGSYGWYNDWRSWLCQWALSESPETIWDNHEQYAGKPFYELIHFSDSEGTIGPRTSAKLAIDFNNHTPPESSENWDVELYEKWKQAFNLAARNGAVKFH